MLLLDLGLRLFFCRCLLSFLGRFLCGFGFRLRRLAHCFFCFGCFLGFFLLPLQFAPANVSPSFLNLDLDGTRGAGSRALLDGAGSAPVQRYALLWFMTTPSLVATQVIKQDISFSSIQGGVYLLVGNTRGCDLLEQFLAGNTDRFGEFLNRYGCHDSNCVPVIVLRQTMVLAQS